MIAIALAVGDALVNRPPHRVGQIVLHCETPLPIAGVEMLHPVSHRTAKVRLKHRVAAIGKKLCPQVERPVIAQPRPAVDIEYER